MEVILNKKFNNQKLYAIIKHKKDYLKIRNWR